MNSITINNSNLQVLDGNRIVLGAGGITATYGTGGTQTLTLGFPMTLSADQTWIFSNTCQPYGCNGFRPILNGSVDLAGRALSWNLPGSLDPHVFLTMNGDLSGNGSLSLWGNRGSATFNGHVDLNGAVEVTALNEFHVVLRNSNNFAGPLTIGPCRSCTVWIDNSGALPPGVTLSFESEGPTYDLATLDLATHSASVSSINGPGMIRFGGGSLTVNAASVSTFTGSLMGTGSLSVTGGTQVLAPFLDSRGLTVGRASSFSGTILVNGGTLVHEGAQFLEPAATTIVDTGTLSIREAADGPPGTMGQLVVNGGTLEIAAPSPRLSNQLVRVSGVTLSDEATVRMTLGARNSTRTHLRVTGAASLGNSSLVVIPYADPRPGYVDTLVENVGSTAISGSFAGLPEGATFSAGGAKYRISYSGGASGRDVRISVVSVETQTTLASSLNPSSQGQIVLLTAVVSSPSSQNIGPPGSVTFYDGATALNTVPVDTSGRAAFATSALSPGTRLLKAVFSGSNGYDSSTSATLTQVVNSLPSTQTTLSSSPNPSIVGQAVTLTASVHSGAGTPTGTVRFADSSITLGTSPLNASGQASLTVSTLAVGIHTLTATYSGATNFASSTSTSVTHLVNDLLPTQTALSIFPHPSQSGEHVELSASVQATNGTPQGTITFSDGPTSLGGVPLDQSGHALFVAPGLSVGVHSLTAFYGGGTTFAPSMSAPVSHEVLPCNVPVITTPPRDATVPSRGSVTLTVATSGDLPQTLMWFLGRYPDASKPLAETSSVTLNEVTTTIDVWVRVNNACGSAHASATVTVPMPARRRAIRRF